MNNGVKAVRPKIVDFFFKNHKNVASSLRRNWGDVSEYQERWCAWWSALNPWWCERTPDGGKLILGLAGMDGWDASSDRDVSWAGFHRPGQCGMLSVLLALRWWFLFAPSENLRQESLNALADVRVVIQELAYDRGYVLNFLH